MTKVVASKQFSKTQFLFFKSCDSGLVKSGGPGGPGSPDSPC